MTQEDVTAVVQRYERVREAVAEATARSGREPQSVEIVAVSKYHPWQAIAAVAGAGQVAFGENYIQEALEKQERLEDVKVSWHFIGKLQSNKAKFATGRFQLVHTVDSRKLAQALHKRAVSQNVTQGMLIQVNIGREAQKSGVAEENLFELAGEVEEMKGLSLEGLMCMPPWDANPEIARPYFERLRRLRDDLQTQLSRPLRHLSMGMTTDFVQAIEEGATLVRIGTAIFGSRPMKTQG